MSKTKKFRDPVHGYILIPSAYCEAFIDTPIFQRLREIEQTGIRVLFPAARHCRFSHSIGVFYLGCKAFDYFRENTKADFKIDNSAWKDYRKSFSLACLLHDCAHAPFSHTYEHFYDYEESGESPLIRKLVDEGQDERFKQDLTKIVKDPDGRTFGTEAAAHEKASALVVLKHYSEALEALGANSLLVARMILGCKYYWPESEEERLENCLIQLLNGKAIDVDKLDYILRDTWSSGISNFDIDIERLLSSLTVIPDKQLLAFKSGALSVLESVVDGRNFLYRWAYAHHKVAYNQYLLETSIEKLARLLAPDNYSKYLAKLFSIESFSQDVEICEGLSIYLPSDNDILFMLKKYRESIAEAKELLSRQHSRKALWKTKAEYEYYFGGLSKEDAWKLEAHAENMLKAAWKEKYGEETFDCLVVPINPKYVNIEKGEVFIRLTNGIVAPYTSIFRERKSDPERFIYAFVTKENIKEKDYLIKSLREAMGCINNV